MEPNETGVVVLDGRVVPFEVRRSGRARHVRLVVGPERRVRIVAPNREPLGKITDLLEPHRLWIFRQFERLELASQRPKEVPEVLPFRGGEIRLVVEAGTDRRVHLEQQTLRVRVPPDERYQPAVEWWYRNEARTSLRDCADLWSTRMGVRYSRLTIRDQRSRWGSCSSLGNLNFNWRLVMAPEPVLEYVVIHELAHLREPNHGHNFWRLVGKWCPDYQRHRDWLQIHGPRLAAVLS